MIQNNKYIFREPDYEAIEEIALNCSIKDYNDCRRLLRKQNNELIEKIYYELMYDKDGNETKFIPLGCTYDKLLDILLKLDGKVETFGNKIQRKARKQISEYEKKISEYKTKLKNLEDEYFRKVQATKK